MFSKISRYRKQEDVVSTDAKGRELTAKDIRLLPEVTGTFIHTVEDGDRLDHLSYKYYKQPRKWWRICDANSAFMSPQALLGKEPIVTDRFPVSFNGGGQPAWAALLKQLSLQVGVENLEIVDDIQIVPETQTVGGEQVIVYVEYPQRAIIVTYNQMKVGSEDLVTVMSSLNFKVGHPENIGRIGKQIIIPPDVVS